MKIDIDKRLHELEQQYFITIVFYFKFLIDFITTQLYNKNR